MTGRILNFRNQDETVQAHKQALERGLMEQSEEVKQIVQTHYKLLANLKSEFIEAVAAQQFSYMFKHVKALESVGTSDKLADMTTYKFALMESSELFDEVSEKRKDLKLYLQESLRDLKMMIEVIERISFSRTPNRFLTLDEIDFLSPDVLLKLSKDEKLYFFKLNQARVHMECLVSEKAGFVRGLTELVSMSYRSLVDGLRSIWKLASRKNRSPSLKVTSGLEFRSRTQSILEIEMLNRKRSPSGQTRERRVKKLEQVTDQDILRFRDNCDESESSVEDRSRRDTQETEGTFMFLRNSFGVKTGSGNTVNVDIPCFRVSEISGRKTSSLPRFKTFSNMSALESELHLPEMNRTLVTSPKISKLSATKHQLDFIPEQNPFIFENDAEEQPKAERDMLENSIFKNPQTKATLNPSPNFPSLRSDTGIDAVMLKKFDSFSSKGASQLEYLLEDSQTPQIIINGEEQVRSQSPSFSKQSGSILSMGKPNPQRANYFRKKRKVENLSTSTLQDSDISGAGRHLVKKDPFEMSNSEEEQFFEQYRNQFDSLFKFEKQETPRPTQLTQNIFYNNGPNQAPLQNVGPALVYQSENIFLGSHAPGKAPLPDESFFEELKEQREGDYLTLAQESMKRDFGLVKKKTLQRSTALVSMTTARSKSSGKKGDQHQAELKIDMKKRNSQDVTPSYLDKV